MHEPQNWKPGSQYLRSYTRTRNRGNPRSDGTPDKHYMLDKMFKRTGGQSQIREHVEDNDRIHRFLLYLVLLAEWLSTYLSYIN